MNKFLVKIDQTKKYIRITIPSKVVEKIGLRKCELAEIQIIGNKTIEVRGIELKKRKKGGVQGNRS